AAIRGTPAEDRGCSCGRSRRRRRSTRKAARDERVTGGVDGVGRLLAFEPGEQVLHPELERDLWAEAEQLLRQARVGVAVADVACAVLVDDLRLDVLAETRRDHGGDLAHRRRD